jgi:hypothetical protein
MLIEKTFGNYLQIGFARAKIFLKTVASVNVLLLIFGGIFRHTAGFAWGYNQNLFYKVRF